jgi:polyprenyldihydroxybenzoate methyltransferase/3-demethylubiquinol 3-O-methyltransferase
MDKLLMPGPHTLVNCIRHSRKPLGSSTCGGHLLLSTISRTPLARLLTITLAEDVLRLVTPGKNRW